MPSDRHLAMSVGGLRDPGMIGRDHWRALAQELSIGERIVLREVERMASAISAD